LISFFYYILYYNSTRMDTTQQKISNWLANPDCDTDFNALVNFLTDECGVVLKPEEEEEQKMDYWVANGGTIEFITCTLDEVMDAEHEEWGDLCNFVDSRK